MLRKLFGQPDLRKIRIECGELFLDRSAVQRFPKAKQRRHERFSRVLRFRVRTLEGRKERAAADPRAQNEILERLRPVAAHARIAALCKAQHDFRRKALRYGRERKQHEFARGV